MRFIDVNKVMERIRMREVQQSENVVADEPMIGNSLQ